MAKNVGEYDEMRIKLRLIELRDAHQTITLNGRRLTIKSVKMEREFGSLPLGTNLRTMSDSAVEALAIKVGAFKAPMGAKADVYINGEGYSVKSHRSAPPAIVNHTPRYGWWRICRQIGADISKLDALVEKYFELRSKGIIREDICNDNHLSPFAAHYEDLRPILNYFLFEGSGAKDSDYPAKYVLDCGDPCDVNTWRLHDESNYLDIYWNRLVFSMRNKGFDGYPYTTGNAVVKNRECKPWAKVFDGTYKGSLHVRVR